MKTHLALFFTEFTCLLEKIKGKFVFYDYNKQIRLIITDITVRVK